MSDQDFIKLLTKTGKRTLIIGFFILLFASFMFWLGLSGADPEMANMSTGGIVTFYTFAGIFFLVGFLMLFLPIRTSMRIKNGKHKLVNAILQNDPSYVLWFYEYITEVKSGPASNTAHQVWIFGSDKKQHSVSVKKGKAQEVINYLAAKFPTAVVGYSKELEAQYKQRVASKN